MSLRPASMPPLMPNVTIEPCALGQVLLRQRVIRARFRPGYFTQVTGGLLLQPLRHGQRVAAVRSMRNFSVSMP